jgi:uncharacterized DUF497 family protein
MIYRLYNNSTDYEFDSGKDRTNIGKHGLSLADAQYFEWETAVIREDLRKQYSEQRLEATSYIGSRLHVMIYCQRGDAVRVISLRKANKREENGYAEA